jgi:hypothetical protein
LPILLPLTIQVFDSLHEPDQSSPTTTGGAGASPSAAVAIQPPGSPGETTGGSSWLAHDSLRFISAGLSKSTAVGIAARLAAEHAPAEPAPAERESDTDSPDSLDEYFRNMR